MSTDRCLTLARLAAACFCFSALIGFFTYCAEVNRAIRRECFASNERIVKSPGDNGVRIVNLNRCD